MTIEHNFIKWLNAENAKAAAPPPQPETTPEPQAAAATPDPMQEERERLRQEKEESERMLAEVSKLTRDMNMFAAGYQAGQRK